MNCFCFVFYIFRYLFLIKFFLFFDSIDNEWIEKDNLHKNLKKELTLSELKVKANSMNPFYRTHRFRPDRRK